MATALITGGTSGIGAAFARALAARGDDLVLVARDTERLTTTAAELTAKHQVRVETVTADLAERGDVDRVAARLADADAPIDRLINNAGYGMRTKLTAPDLEPHLHALDVMVKAVLLLSGTAGRVMAERGAGSILNVSSTAGLMTMGGYSALKAWVTTYTESLATELAGSGVKVTALLPGWVRTEFHSRAEIGTSSIPEQLWLDADDLVAEALADNDRGRVISIPSKRYAALMLAARHAPRPLIRTVSARLSGGRH